MIMEDSTNSHLSHFRRNFKDTCSYNSINSFGFYPPPAETGVGRKLRGPSDCNKMLPRQGLY